MKTLTKYILLEFFKIFAMAIAGFIMVFLLVDIFENMNNLMKNKVPFASSAMFFIYKIPFIVVQTVPIAVLLAVLLTLGMLSKHNEITAIKAGGIRLIGVLKPLFIIGVIISAAILFMNETITPSATKKTEEFRRAWFGSGKLKSFGAEGMWIRTGSGIVNIKYFDIKTKEMRGVTIYKVEKPFTLKTRIQADKLAWDGNIWLAKTATAWHFTRDGSLSTETAKNFAFDGLYPPDELIGAEDIQKNMTASELNRYIKNIEADGYSSNRYRTDLYGKLTFPMVSFIMVIVGIPFALKTGRSSGIAGGVGLSVIIAFSYWVVFAASRSLGTNGVVPPVVAAAFPDALFLTIGILMMSYVKE
ncbi:LPS export ABC transporter permease LptG [bacterium]|nr:MAG: LPS export ABC transporter permease LptG [bacterium]